MFKTTVLADDGIYEVDVIYHKGAFWLVPSWLLYQEKGKIRPEIMIPVDAIPHRRYIENGETRIQIINPMPSEVFSVDMPPEIIRAFGVLVLPEVFFDIPDDGNKH